MQKKPGKKVALDKPGQRYLLKLSGEILGGKAGFGFDYAVVERICSEVAQLLRSDRKLAIVVGAGNFCRGREAVSLGIHPVIADRTGMIATLINAMTLEQFLKRLGAAAEVMSAFEIAGQVRRYESFRASELVTAGTVVICAGGTGNPFFSTDTAAVLRALELGCDYVLKGTLVDGVYDSDPHVNRSAKKFDTISYDEVLRRNLKVIDATAVSLAREHGMPIIVFNIGEKGALLKISRGDLKEATLIT